MINYDKRKFSICIVRDSKKDIHYKHFDSKKANCCEWGYTRGENLSTCKMEDGCCENCIHWQKTLGVKNALKEAQRLANKTGQKVIVLTSAYNVYPDYKEIPDEFLEICNICQTEFDTRIDGNFTLPDWQSKLIEPVCKKCYEQNIDIIDIIEKMEDEHGS